MMPQNEHIRQILYRMGIPDEQIGWDQGAGQVTIRDQPFAFPGQVVDGRFMTNEADVQRTLGMPSNTGTAMDQVMSQVFTGRPTGVGTPQAQTPQTFGYGDLQQLLQGLQGVGGTPQRQHQTPDQLMQLITMMQQQMQPMVDSRQADAQARGEQDLRAMQDMMARRGMVASGVAGAQQQAGMGELNRLLDAISGEAQAQAIPLGLQYADLGMREEEMARRFELDRAGMGLEGLLQGLGLQEQMRLGEQGLDLQRMLGNQSAEQNWLNSLISAGAHQTGADIDLRRLAENVRQFDTMLPIHEAPLTGRYQGEQTMDARRFAEQIRQFERNFGLQEGALMGMYGGQRTLAGQQFDASEARADQAQQHNYINQLLSAAGMFGHMPEGMENLPEWLQPFVGQQTLANQQWLKSLGEEELDVEIIEIARRHGISEPAAEVVANTIRNIDSDVLTSMDVDKVSASVRADIEGMAHMFPEMYMTLMPEIDNIVETVLSMGMGTDASGTSGSPQFYEGFLGDRAQKEYEDMQRLMEMDVQGDNWWETFQGMLGVNMPWLEALLRGGYMPEGR